MGFERGTVGIGRADLVQDCLRSNSTMARMQTVEGIGVPGDLRGGFSVHQINYRVSQKKIG